MGTKAQSESGTKKASTRGSCKLEQTLVAVTLSEIEKRLLPKPVAAIKVDAESGSSDQSATKRSRPAHRNVIVPCFNAEGRARVFAALELLIELYPSRFFIVDIRSEHSEITAQIGIPEGEAAGSQIVALTCSNHDLGAVVGLLRAHMLVGVSTELGLFDGALSPQALTALLPLVDGALLESELFDHLGSSGWGDGRSALFEQILSSGMPVVDTGWLALSTLREEIRHGYERCSIYTKQLSLDIEYARTNKEVTAQSKNDEMGLSNGLPTIVALFVGWCVSRLGGEKLVRTNDGARCTVYPQGNFGSQTGIPLTIRLKECAQASGDANILRVTFSGEKEKFSVSCNENQLITEVEGRERFRVSRVAESGTRAERWRRYFLIGEAITNYRQTLHTALPLFK